MKPFSRSEIKGFFRIIGASLFASSLLFLGIVLSAGSSASSANRSTSNDRSISSASDGVDSDESIGGEWHQQAIDAWKEFNKGKNSPESDLKIFLLHGASSDLHRYYAIACKKGHAGFCALLAASVHSRNESASLSKRACEISGGDGDCLVAVVALVNANRIKEAKDIFESKCNADGPYCAITSDGKFRNFLSAACTDGHAFSCSLLTKYGITHTTPPSAVEAEADFVKAQQKAQQDEINQMDHYDTADCDSIEECKATGNNPPKDYINGTPFYAKACSLGDAGSCLVVGEIKENQKDEVAAYSWFRKGCDNAPTNILICLAAVDAKLKTNDIAMATALFVKISPSDRDDVFESQVLYQAKKSRSAYKNMLVRACHDKHKPSCRILSKLR
jgi:hypothetical protein